jgi:hypothetical protein
MAEPKKQHFQLRVLAALDSDLKRQFYEYKQPVETLGYVRDIAVQIRYHGNSVFEDMTEEPEREEETEEEHAARLQRDTDRKAGLAASGGKHPVAYFYSELLQTVAKKLPSIRAEGRNVSS